MCENCSKTRRLTGRISRLDTSVIWGGFNTPGSPQLKALSAMLHFALSLLLGSSEIFINACLFHELEFHCCDVSASPEFTFMQKYLKIEVQIHRVPSWIF